MNLKSGWLFLVVLSLLAGVVGGCGLDGEKGGESALALIEAQPLYLPLEVAARKVEPDETGSIRLAVGEPLEAWLASGEVHRFALPERPSGEEWGGEWFAATLLDQRGIDLVLKLVDEGGRVLFETDSYNLDQGLELLEALTSVAGPSFLEVESFQSANELRTRSGRYRIELLDWQPATVANRRRVEVATEVWSLVAVCNELERKDPVEAVRNCEMAARRAEELGDAHRAGWAYLFLGRVRMNRGNFQIAQEHFAQARRAWAPPRYLVEQALVSIEETDLASRRGDFSQAFAINAKIIELWRSRGAVAQLSSAVNLRGLMLKELGQLEASIEAFEAAEELGEQIGDSVAVAKSIFNRGVAEFRLGHYLAARDLYAGAESRLEGLEATELESLIHVLIAQTTLYGRRGELWLMGAVSERALSLMKDRDDPNTRGTLIQNRASYLLALGDMEAALGSYLSALKFFQQGNHRPREAFTLANLGHLRARQGEQKDALELLEQALRIGREIEDPTVISLALEWRGKLRGQQGELGAALEDLEEALRIVRKSKERQRQVSCLNAIAEVHLEAGRFAEVGATLAEALSLNRGLEPVREANSRYLLARQLRAVGDLEAALSQMERVLAIDEELREGLAVTEARDAFLADRRIRFETMIDLLVRLDNQVPTVGYAQRAFSVSEQARARGLAELLAEANVELRQALDPALLAQEERLEQEIASGQADLRSLKSQPDSNAQQLEELQLRVAGLRNQRRRLKRQIRQTSPRFADLTYPQSASLREIQALLAPGTVILEYMIGDGGCRLFVIGRHRFEVVELAISAAAVGQAVAELRHGLAGTGRFQTRRYQQAAHQLFLALIAPAEPFLSDVQRLVVVPDRELYYVPFEALLTEEPSTRVSEFAGWPFLIRRFEISYSPSASVLATLEQAEPAPTNRLLIFADPVYRGRLERLAASGREAREIAALFPDPSQVTVLLREEASEAQVKNSSELPRARWVHFATHGTFDGEETAENSLELTGGGSAANGTGGEDGSLHLREIFDLDLRAEMVVLSACQTALGREVTGEGLVGLSRGFFYAGASSLVMSQWRVEDEQTANLMVRFYRSLLTSGDPIAALKQAKLESIDDEQTGAHPHYWAPFVLVGKPLRGNL